MFYCFYYNVNFEFFIFREVYLSVDRFSFILRRFYFLYSDYVLDLLDVSYRSMFGTLLGSYEFYDAEVSGLIFRYRF